MPFALFDEQFIDGFFDLCLSLFNANCRRFEIYVMLSLWVTMYKKQKRGREGMDDCKT